MTRRRLVWVGAALLVLLLAAAGVWALEPSRRPRVGPGTPEGDIARVLDGSIFLKKCFMGSLQAGELTLPVQVSITIQLTRSGREPKLLGIGAEAPSLQACLQRMVPRHKFPPVPEARAFTHTFRMK